MALLWDIQKRRAPTILNSITGVILAYSLRKLNTTTVPIGACRSSDNAETDINLDSGGVTINTSSTVAAGGSLATWVGANNATTSNWYDQSGNGITTTNSNLSLRPNLITLGNLYTKGTKPTVNFSGTKYYNTPHNAAMDFDNGYSLFWVASINNFFTYGKFIDKLDVAASYQGIGAEVYQSSGNFVAAHQDTTTARVGQWASPFPVNTLFCAVLRMSKNGDMTLKVNNSNKGSATFLYGTAGNVITGSLNNSIVLKIGGHVTNASNYILRGNISEYILTNNYASDAERDAWIANAMTYYGIT
jgi:hypothetical protein